MTQEHAWEEQTGEYKLRIDGLTFVYRERDEQGKVLSELEILGITHQSVGYICGGRGFGFQQRGRASGFLVLEHKPQLQQATGLPQERKRSLDYLLKGV